MVQADRSQAILLLALLVPAVMIAKLAQATVEDTGSSNRVGLRVTVDRGGHAIVEPRSGDVQHVDLPVDLCKRFLQDVEAAEPVNELPPAHCVKSVSFGSRTFIESNGHRSPDVSCPSGDARSQLLQKDANDVLQAAREAAHIRSGRIFAIPAPHRQ